jgi:hypothetical protein
LAFQIARVSDVAWLRTPLSLKISSVAAVFSLRVKTSVSLGFRMSQMLSFLADA